MNATIVTALQTAGIAPDYDLVAQRELDRCIDASGNLMPWLKSVWRRHSTGEETQPWLRTSCPSELFLVDQSRGPRAVFELLGTRLLWRPNNTRFFGIVSSRLGRDLNSKSAWFRSLRAASVQGAQRGEALITAPGTTTDRFARRCQDLFGVNVCDTIIGDARELVDWMQIVIDDASRGRSASAMRISPQIDTTTVLSAYSDIPETDRAVVAFSDRLIALSVRKGGNLDRLIRWRLQSQHFETGQTLLALGKQLVADQVRDSLLGCGAVGWTVWPRPSTDPTLTTAKPAVAGWRCASGDKDAAAVDSDEDADTTRPQAARTREFKSKQRAANHSQPPALPRGHFLTHCTRRRDGPWPDQDEKAYLDDLILERDQADHSALAALKRIITMRRLVAANESIHGNTPVVSFTEVPLEELHCLRVFRPHRGRWDFEPYGICIRREWILQNKGRPVRYAPRNQWMSLPESERLFYQLDVSVTKKGNEIDWTVEQEWRAIGDLQLESLSAADAFVFVPTMDAVAQISNASPWPVVAMSDFASVERFATT